MSPHRLAACAAACLLTASMFSHTVALRLLLLTLAVGLLIVTAVRERGASTRFVPPLWPFFAIWAAWAALSLAWSVEPARSLKEFRAEIALTALSFWICFVAAQARGAARIMLPIAAMGAAAACGVALHFHTRGWEHYLSGWHGGPGDHSSLLLTVMPCALLTAWYGLRNGWGRARLWLTAALIALLLVSAYTTQNRTVWLGFGIELLLAMAMLRALRPANGPALGVRAMAGAGLVALAVVAGVFAATMAVHRERAALNSAREFEKDPRLALWPEVIERIQERPLSGYGFGRGGLRDSLRSELGDRQLWHAHNLFLDTTLQLGVPGLLILVALLAATLREAWRLSRTGQDLPLACGVALAAIVAGMLMRNMTDMLWIRQNAILYWGVAGTLLGLAAAFRAPPRAAR
jgi:exopolysaccharide production protein ExoQ